jgi:hypothetical protein
VLFQITAQQTARERTDLFNPLGALKKSSIRLPTNAKRPLGMTARSPELSN